VGTGAALGISLAWGHSGWVKAVQRTIMVQRTIRFMQTPFRSAYEDRSAVDVEDFAGDEARVGGAEE
jgi:hypothetical protein